MLSFTSKYMGKVNLSLKEQIIFFKQFGLLLQGGISLLDTLQTISQQFKSKQGKLFVNRLFAEIQQGRLLSQSLLLFPKTFDPTTLSLIEVGEASGTLAQSLVAASSELEQRQATRKKITAALIYPAIVIGATFGIIGLLILYVFPKVLPVFSSVHLKLPLTTRLLISGNSLVRDYSWQTGLGLLFLALIIWVAATNKKLKPRRDRLLLVLPFIRQLTKNYFLARSLGTLGKLLQKQVPIIKAVVITANATGHTVYKQRLIALSMSLSRGESLTQFLAAENSFLFPVVLRQLVAVGERTGTLSDNLIFLSRLYEQEISDTMANISVILEPAMMVAIGGLVGFVAVSIITPIYQITQNLHA